MTHSVMTSAMRSATAGTFEPSAEGTSVKSLLRTYDSWRSLDGVHSTHRRHLVCPMLLGWREARSRSMRFHLLYNRTHALHPVGIQREIQADLSQDWTGVSSHVSHQGR